MALSVGVSAVASHASSATTSAVTTTANSGIEIIVTATGTTAPTVSDSKGCTWTQIGSRVEVASYPGSIWHFKNEGGTRGSSHTFTAAAGDVSILVQEVLGDSPVVDVSNEGVDNGTSPWDSPTLTPTVPDFLLVAGIGTNSAGSTETYTAGNSFTRQQQVQNGSLYWTCAVGTRVVAGGSGSYNSSWTAAYAPTSSGHTITAWKEASGGPSIGGHGLDYDTMGTSGSSVGTSSFTSAASGSIILAGVGRGVLSDHASATVDDNKGNGAYTQLGTAHGYWYWPTSGPAIFAKIGAAGGAGHIVSASKPTATDEVTVVAAEFRGVSRIVDYQWVEDLSSPNTSASVTVPGDAILCAFWWGDDATGNSGFTSINTGWTELDKTTSTGGNHVQVGSAYKVVGAGSHTVEWTPAVSQGAQLWIVAMDAGAAAPIIDRHPQAARVGAGDLATFTVAATTSGGALSYQWNLDGVNVGANEASYSRRTLPQDNGKSVTVVVTDSNGSTTSSAAVLTVVTAVVPARRKAARTTADASAAGWFSELLAPAAAFDRDMLVMPSAGGGTAVGLATEAGAALALSGRQTRALGLAIETGTALALGAVAVRSVGLATDGAAALTLVARQVKATGLAAEAGTALALAGVQVRAAGLALEAGVSIAMAAQQIRATGQAAEANSALGLSALQLRTAGLANATDAAIALVAKQIAPTGLAAEAGAAFALTPAAGSSVGLATEADTALALAGRSIRATGLASEADSTLGLPGRQTRPVGLAAEAGAALALAGVQIRPTGLTTEADTAPGLPGLQLRAVGLSGETDMALALSAGASSAVGQAVETGTALSLQGRQVRAVGLASQADHAFAVLAVQRLLAGLAVESDAALALAIGSALAPGRRSARSDPVRSIVAGAAVRKPITSTPPRALIKGGNSW